MNIQELINLRKETWEKTKDIEEDYLLRRAIYAHVTENKEVLIELLDNPHLLIELQFTVVNKEFVEVPFFLNDVQRELQDKILVPQIKEQDQGLRDQMKIKILKGRQQGITTYITAFQLCLALSQPNFAGFTMAHDTDSTKSIFEDIAKGFYSRLIDDLKDELNRSNAKELVFKNIVSSWRVSTAGSKGAGRGKRLRMLHNSEKAFWKDMRKNELAISQALTPTGSIEIDETTGNGFNEFQEDWEEIEQGNSKWTGVFFEWWRTREYKKSFNDVNYSYEEFEAAIFSKDRFRGVDSNFMSKLFELLKNGLNIYQLHWYFDKRRELKDKVSQEYPCTPEEAFLHSGRPYFDIELLDIQIQQLKNSDFISESGGEIEIYKHPIPGHTYSIGSDVAEGLEDCDSSTFTIVDDKTGEEVANGEYIAKPDQHARVLAKWATRYNNALLGVERNNHGHSTLNTLMNECRYRNIYIETTVDKVDNKHTDKPGWATNEKSKFIMLDELDSAHRDGNILIKSIRTLKEMRGIQNKNGKIETGGKDRVISLAIAWQMRKYRKNNRSIDAPIFKF